MVHLGVMVVLEPIHLFRITHVNNVPHTLLHGLWTKDGPNRNPDFVPIGDREIISARSDMIVQTPSNGSLSEYIPFYFGARSPMLYVIQKGYNGVKRLPPSEIVYILVPLAAVISEQLDWCFTDGNARDLSSAYFCKLEDLERLDWATIRSEQWHNTETDSDKKRRKQAEFLIKNHVPPRCISHIIVYDQEKLNFVQHRVQQSGMNISVRESKKHYY